MTDLRTAAQQALKSLRGYRREIGCEQPCDAERALEAAINLRAALEQPEQEPVAWWIVSKTTDEEFVSVRTNDWSDINWEKHPLYAHPPRRKPLSDEELDRLWREPMSADWEHREYARAIEAAHGIKENT
jgi:hypothetical protein